MATVLLRWKLIAASDMPLTTVNRSPVRNISSVHDLFVSVAIASLTEATAVQTVPDVFNVSLHKLRTWSAIKRDCNTVHRWGELIVRVRLLLEKERTDAPVGVVSSYVSFLDDLAKSGIRVGSRCFPRPAGDL